MKVAQPSLESPSRLSRLFLARLVAGACLWLSGAELRADTIELNPNHPDRYVVVPGDTLWDIAGRFLQRPWQWPEIWHDNPQINNPHWIYPGDALVLRFVNGQPQLQLESAGSSQDFAPQSPSEGRLSPRIRATRIDQAIPAIPVQAIRQFLSRPQVVEPSQLQNAPYVVAFADEHVVGGAGNRIFVRAIEDARNSYTILRQGKPYTDTDTGELLGYEAVFIGDTRVEQTGDPATLFIERADQEVRIGDRLLPTTQEQLRLYFQPHAPKTQMRGHIIDVLNGVTQIGQYSIVALDKGAADGIEVGHVLAIYQQGKIVRDIVSSRGDESVVMPEQKAGLLMVFRTFSRVSYALVMHANRALHVLDSVQTP